MRHNELLETLYPPEKLNDKILDKILKGFFTFQHSFSSSEMEQDLLSSQNISNAWI